MAIGTHIGRAEIINHLKKYTRERKPLTKKNKQKKTRELQNALIKLGCCGYCANRENNNKQLNLFCKKNIIINNKESKNVPS